MARPNPHAWAAASVPPAPPLAIRRRLELLAPIHAGRRHTALLVIAGGGLVGGGRYPGHVARLRVALCQINTTVGDLDGNVDRVIAALERSRGPGLRPRRVPRAGPHRLPTRGPAAQAGLRRRQPAGARPRRPRLRRVRRGGGLRRRRPRPLQRGGGVRVRPGPGRVPQAQPAQLRGVRRAALLRPGHGPLPARRGRRGAGGRVDLRGRLQPHRSHRHPGRRRGRAGGQHQRLAVLRRPVGRARAHAGDEGVRRLVRPRLREPGRRPGRARVRRRRRWSSTPTAASSPAPGSSREETLVCDVEVLPVFRKRLLDPRGRIVEPSLPVVDVSSSPRVDDPGDVCRGEIADALPPVQEVYEALVTGTRDYVHKNGFTDVAIAPVGRHRLVAGRRHRRRRRRARSRPRRADAVALLVRPLAVRRREARRRARHRAPGDPDRARPRRLPRHAGAELRGPRRRHHRGEPAVAASAAW